MQPVPFFIKETGHQIERTVGKWKKDKCSAPVYEALEKLKKRRVVPFDVPGHKRGRGNPELVELLGEKCVSLDVNSMKPLDNLCHPVSVIKEAEELAAEAFRADHAFYGWRNNVLCSGYGAFCLQGRR